MKVKVSVLNGWELVRKCARATIWKDDISSEVSEAFKKRMIVSEHSPLRELRMMIEVIGIRSWVATHFVRHHQGLEKYVSTQRIDRKASEVSRDDIPQGALVNLTITINAQALINISKVRLCHEASKETRFVWSKIVSEIRKIEPMLASAMVPSCVYRGFCSEHRENCINYASWRKVYLEKFA